MHDNTNADTDMVIEEGGAIARRPHWRMLLNPIHFLALGFGAGLSPMAPGTVATLYAWLSFSILSHWLTPFSWGFLLGLGLLLGVGICTYTGKALGEHDHRAIVWDEIIAFWLILWLLSPASFSTQLWAFLWFRFFDIKKPGPIRYLDQHLNGPGWRGGVGVMADDLLAAFFTLLLFAVWRAI